MCYILAGKPGINLAPAEGHLFPLCFLQNIPNPNSSPYIPEGGSFLRRAQLVSATVLITNLSTRMPSCLVPLGQIFIFSNLIH